MDVDKNFETILKEEIESHVANYWYFYNAEWKFIQNRYNHRTKIKEFKNNTIRYIKDYLVEKLGFTAVFFFINILFGNKETPGPYKEVEKALLLLYHIVSGENGTEMSRFIPYTSFYRLYKCFWIERYTELNKIAKYDLENLFSNIKIRILSARLNNPEYLENVTLFIDGVDSKIKYYKPFEQKKFLYSYKLHGKGIRTQMVCDINGMILYTSKSEKCAMNNDGSMFINMDLHKKISTADVICADGGYNLYIDKFIEKAINDGYDEFKTRNFQIPIRKEKNKTLTSKEIILNQKIGSFRSEMENQFQQLTSIFKRFTNNRSSLQLSDIKVYNLQFRIACLLKNIRFFMEKFNIEPDESHKLWYNDDFEFPSKTNKIQIIFNNEQKNDANYNEIINIQENILKIDIKELKNNKKNDDLSDSDSEHENNIVDEYIVRGGKRLKKLQPVVQVNVHE